MFRLRFMSEAAAADVGGGVTATAIYQQLISAPLGYWFIDIPAILAKHCSSVYLLQYLLLFSYKFSRHNVKIN